MYQVTVPIYLPQTKKKNFALNLNIYRNAHFLVLNNMKVKFKELIWEQLSSLPTMDGVKLTYTLFMGTNREVDLSNICVVVDKFFCDALVEAGKLLDDSVTYLRSIDYRFGGVDKNNPRVEVTLEPNVYIKEDTTMRISLVQAEIELALEKYIGEQLNVADGKAFKISLAATRGEQGFTAEIDIVDKEEEPEPAKVTKRGPRNKVTEAVGQGNVFANTAQSTEFVQVEDETPETAGEADEGETAPSADEAGVPAFLQKKSIFGTAASN